MLSRENREALLGYLVLLPVFIALALVIYYPGLRAVFQSFTDYSVYFPEATFIGLENYLSIFGDRDFWMSLRHSFILVFVAVSLQYVLGLILALLLNEELPGLRWVKSIVIIPWIIPIAATVVMFDWMAVPSYGLANIVLESIGLGHLTRYWFGDLQFAFPMVMLMHVWRNMPFYAITLYAALKGIPKMYYEAASIDGASTWQSFKSITLPQIKYPSMIMIVLHVLFTFNNFDIVHLSTGGGPVGRSEVLATYVYKNAWTFFDFGRASAVGTIMMLIMMTFSIMYIRLIRSES